MRAHHSCPYFLTEIALQHFLFLRLVTQRQKERERENKAKSFPIYMSSELSRVVQELSRVVQDLTSCLKLCRVAKSYSELLRVARKQGQELTNRCVLELSRIVPELTRVVQSCPELSRVAQSCPKLPRVTQSCEKKVLTD